MDSNDPNDTVMDSNDTVKVSNYPVTDSKDLSNTAKGF